MYMDSLITCGNLPVQRTCCCCTPPISIRICHAAVDGCIASMFCTALVSSWLLERYMDMSNLQFQPYGRR